MSIYPAGLVRISAEQESGQLTIFNRHSLDLWRSSGFYVRSGR